MQYLISVIVGTLDSIPDAVRALLAAFVLAGVFGILGHRIPPSRAGVAVSFRKSAIVAAILIPLIVCFALNWRFVVMVEELPAIPKAPQLLWWGIWVVWLTGVVYRTGGLLRSVPRKPKGISDDSVDRRKAIWCQRMGIDPDGVVVLLDGDERPRSYGWFRQVITLPQGAQRWQTSILDAVLAHELALSKSHAWRWLVASEAVSVLYWPTPWLRELPRILNAAYQYTGDSGALSFYKDRIDYARALRHVAARMQSADLAAHTGILLAATTSADLEQRASAIKEEGLSDPRYDRVFWALAQATLAVFILTGTTPARGARRRGSQSRYLPAVARSFRVKRQVQGRRTEDTAVTSRSLGPTTSASLQTSACHFLVDVCHFSGRLPLQWTSTSITRPVGLSRFATVMEITPFVASA